MSCLQCFRSERFVINHREVCLEINGHQTIKIPEKGSKIKFENYHKQCKVPFIIYADFEAITQKINGCELNVRKSYKEVYQNHKDCSYGYKVVCCYDDKYSKSLTIYRAENAVYKFMEKMIENCELK